MYSSRGSEAGGWNPKELLDGLINPMEGSFSPTRIISASHPVLTTVSLLRRQTHWEEPARIPWLTALMNPRLSALRRISTGTRLVSRNRSSSARVGGRLPLSTRTSRTGSEVQRRTLSKQRLVNSGWFQMGTTMSQRKPESFVPA